MRRTDSGVRMRAMSVLGGGALVGDAERAAGSSCGVSPSAAQLGVERRAVGGVEQDRAVEQLAFSSSGVPTTAIWPWSMTQTRSASSASSR